MNVGFISDIHANRVALEAVLDDMPSVDTLVCCGDIIGYNPWPAECVERVREVADVVVQGNHDRDVQNRDRYRVNSGAHAGLEFAAEQLSDEQLDWLANLPPQTTAINRTVRVVHSHPTNLDEYVTPRKFTAMGSHLNDEEQVLVMGHTHVQHMVNMEKYESSGIILNPGSVGQPRDNDSRAAYAVLDTDSWTVDPCRVEYDIEAVQAEIEEVGLPRKTATRLENGK